MSELEKKQETKDYDRSLGPGGEGVLCYPPRRERIEPHEHHLVLQKKRAQEMLEEIQTLKEQLRVAQEGGPGVEEENEENLPQNDELDEEESDPDDRSYEEEEDEPESEDYSYEQGSRREKELLEEEQRIYDRGLGFGRTAAEPRSRTNLPGIILPSDESDNCPPGIELPPVIGNLAYEHMAEQLREMQKVSKERGLRLQRVEKEVRAQKGEDSDDELEAMKNPLTEQVLRQRLNFVENVFVVADLMTLPSCYGKDS